MSKDVLYILFMFFYTHFLKSSLDQCSSYEGPTWNLIVSMVIFKSERLKEGYEKMNHFLNVYRQEPKPRSGLIEHVARMDYINVHLMIVWKPIHGFGNSCTLLNMIPRKGPAATIKTLPPKNQKNVC
jgi:hypothetical protein